MVDVVIERALPSPIALLALDEALRTVLGERCTGQTAKGQYITVHLTDNVTESDIATAQQIVMDHDFEKRTAVQISREKRDQNLASLRLAIKALRAKPVGDATKSQALMLEWLTLEVEAIKEQLGIMDLIP